MIIVLDGLSAANVPPISNPISNPLPTPSDTLTKGIAKLKYEQEETQKIINLKNDDQNRIENNNNNIRTSYK